MPRSQPKPETGSSRWMTCRQVAAHDRARDATIRLGGGRI